MNAAVERSGDDSRPVLTGQRILVVEDDMLVAVLIEEVLHDLGCIVVGPVGKLDEAMRLAGSEPLDGAVLDVKIRGGSVCAVADCLTDRNIPFVLASGYNVSGLPARLLGRPRLTKPFSEEELTRQIRQLKSCEG